MGGLLVLLCIGGCEIPRERSDEAKKWDDEVDAWLAAVESSGGYLETSERPGETDVDALISIRRPDQVRIARRALLATIWGKLELPEALPTEKADPRMESFFQDVASLANVQTLVISMDLGLESIVAVLTPTEADDCAVIYHGDHDPSQRMKRHVGQFLSVGCHVAVISMPLRGPNPKPVFVSPRFGRLKLTRHDEMALLDLEDGHPFKFFIEPVIVVVNYLRELLPDASIAMTGRSGGGWTTTLAAAIDPRIARSFPVAGSYPIHIRTDAPWDWGDWEQTVPEIYTVANYLELYLMGGYGRGRKQLQILNHFDPCCFSGIRSQEYEEFVARRLEQLGEGEFEVMRDLSHREHEISEAAMERILEEIKSEIDWP